MQITFIADDTVLKDILYRLKNNLELRPSIERIQALSLYDDATIKEIISIWEHGHVVKSTPERIFALEKVLNENP